MLNVWAFLWAHWGLSAAVLAIPVAVVAVGLLGGLPLLLNRWVLGVLATLLLGALAALAWAGVKDHYREEGAKAIAAADYAAGEARRKLLDAFALERSDAVKEGQERLALQLQLLDKLRQERKSHVSQAADRKCAVPVGFVYDHNAALPGAAGRAAVPEPAAGAADAPSGVVLSALGACVASNYTECGKLQARLDACENARYTACVQWDQRFGTNSGCTR